MRAERYMVKPMRNCVVLQCVVSSYQKLMDLAFCQTCLEAWKCKVPQTHVSHVELVFLNIKTTRVDEVASSSVARLDVVRKRKVVVANLLFGSLMHKLNGPIHACLYQSSTKIFACYTQLTLLKVDSLGFRINAEQGLKLMGFQWPLGAYEPSKDFPCTIPLGLACVVQNSFCNASIAKAS